jgi:hypothetical protein
MKKVELIDKSLKIIGLRGRTMANLSMLSIEMKKVLGETISAITLYRISSPRKTTYRPFKHSIAILEEFIAQCNYSEKRLLVNNNNYYISNNPRESFLYITINHLFQKEDWTNINQILSKINISKPNLGFERYPIAFAISDYLKSIKTKEIKDTLEQNIISHPYFSIFYLETYIDFSNQELYLKVLNIWLKHNTKSVQRNIYINQYNKIYESWLFAYSIKPFFMVILKNKEELTDCYQALFVSTTKEIFYKLINHNTILSARILGAKMIISNFLSKPSIYNECVENLFNIELDLINENGNSFEKAFCTTILLDTFVICNDKEGFISLLKKSNKSAFKTNGEATILRMQYYLDMYYSKNISIAKKDSYYLSEGEVELHYYLIECARKWFVK